VRRERRREDDPTPPPPRESRGCCSGGMTTAGFVFSPCDCIGLVGGLWILLSIFFYGRNQVSATDTSADHAKKEWGGI